MSIPKSKMKAKMHPVEPKSLKTNSKPPNHFDKKPNITSNNVKITLQLRNHVKKIKSHQKIKVSSTYCTLKCMTHHLLMVRSRLENVHLNLQWLFLHICPILPHFDL